MELLFVKIAMELTGIKANKQDVAERFLRG